MMRTMWKTCRANDAQVMRIDAPIRGLRTANNRGVLAHRSAPSAHQSRIRFSTTGISAQVLFVAKDIEYESECAPETSVTQIMILQI